MKLHPKKIVVAFLAVYSSLFGAERAAIAYDFSGGRFGDNLLSYLHGLWIAYTYDLDLVYKPFEFSDQLLLHNMGLDKNHPFKKHVICDGDVDALLQSSNLSESTLFTIHYFPELSWGGELEKEIPIYHRKIDINWDDPGFRSLMKKLISSKLVTPTPIQIPKDRFSVAVHVRTGGSKKEAKTIHDKWPVKAPRLSFHISQVEFLYEYLGRIPLFLYIFTDDLDPQNLASIFAEALLGLDIQIGYREAGNSEKENILEDFFALTKFDSAIHGDSNFAICAGLISDYTIEIRPMSSEYVTGCPNIDRICMRVKHPQGDIEYIYTSVSLSPL